MRTNINQPVPTSGNKDIDIIFSKLSQEAKVRFEEVKALIVAGAALEEFPRHLVMRAMKLPNDKRQALIDMVRPLNKPHLRESFFIIADYNESVVKRFNGIGS